MKTTHVPYIVSSTTVVFRIMGCNNKSNKAIAR